MKLSECNARERKAFLNIKYASYDLIGGLENTMLDYSEDSEQYKRAKALLDNHEALVAELYSMATTAIYEEGCCIFNDRLVQKLLRDINFCGKEWLMERCERRITKEGY